MTKQNFVMQSTFGGRGLPLFLCLLLQIFNAAKLENVDEVAVEIVVKSTPCSATCGLGFKAQTLCLLKDSKAAVEEDPQSGGKTEVSDVCRVRKVKCQMSWQCGLSTMTVVEGQRVEFDCLREIVETVGKFSPRVFWRYAPGIITSDDTLFARWKAPLLDRVILDPVREKDAGTYRCDVQDKNFRRVKRAYWGIRVLPSGIFDLDYEGTLSKWDNWQNQTMTHLQDYKTVLIYMVLIPLSFAGAVVGLMVGLYWAMKTGKLRTMMSHPVFSTCNRRLQRQRLSRQ